MKNKQDFKFYTINKSFLIFSYLLYSTQLIHIARVYLKQVIARL